MMMGAIRTKGVRVTRNRLRDSIQRVDALGAITRWISIIPRRTYQRCRTQRFVAHRWTPQADSMEVCNSRWY